MDRDKSLRPMDISELRNRAFSNSNEVDEMQFDEGGEPPTSC